jgi:rubredoxin
MDVNARPIHEACTKKILAHFLPKPLDLLYYKTYWIVTITNYRSSPYHERNKVIKQYTCQVCGYVYDPASGDADGGVAPGTAFENLPDSWVCPVCGAGKDMFASE